MQAGEYELSAAQSIMDIAAELQDATPHEITFVILPGWRLEEIANSIPSSGLSFSPDDVLDAAYAPKHQLSFLPTSASIEGFLYPDAYTLPRETGVDEFINITTRNFSQQLSPELLTGFSNQGLDVFQAVTLASIVERESVKDEEQSLIASVFLN